MSSSLTFRTLLERPRLAWMAARIVQQPPRLAVRFFAASIPPCGPHGRSERRTTPKPPTPLPAYPLPDASGEDRRVYLHDVRRKVAAIFEAEGPMKRETLLDKYLPEASIPTYRGEANAPPYVGWTIGGDAVGAQPRVITARTLKMQIVRPMVFGLRLKSPTTPALRHLANEVLEKADQASAEARDYARRCLERIDGYKDHDDPEGWLYISTKWWDTMSIAVGKEPHGAPSAGTIDGHRVVVSLNSQIKLMPVAKAKKAQAAGLCRILQ